MIPFSAFWAACYAHNIANLKWSYMIDDIAKRQSELEAASVDMVAAVEKEYRHHGNNDLVEEAYFKNAEKIVSSLWSLSDELMFKFADGFVNRAKAPPNGEISKPVGYPAWWLEAVGYKDGPPPPPTKPKCCNPPKNTTMMVTSDSHNLEAKLSRADPLLRGTDGGDRTITVGHHRAAAK